MAINFSRERLKQTAGTQGDHAQGSHFTVELAGKQIGGIDEYSGLASETEVISYRDTDGAIGHMNQRPGNHKVINFKLGRPYGNTREFKDWFGKVQAGQTERITVTVSQHSDDDSVHSQIHVYECWPFAYGIDGFDSKSSALLREYVECVGERIEYK